MRRAWIHRFIGLLWLALCSTAVLPWAHELGHLAEHSPPSAPTAWPEPSGVHAPAAQASAVNGDQDDDHAADACVVCLHLFGQHLSPTATAAVALAVSRQLAPHYPAAGTDHAPPGWLTPAPRAPPSLHA